MAPLSGLTERSTERKTCERWVVCSIGLTLICLIIAAFASPLLIADVAYTPTFANTTTTDKGGNTLNTSYQLQGVGRAIYTAFTYQQHFLLTVTNTASDGTTTVSDLDLNGGANGVKPALGVACQYPVVAHVASIDWIGWRRTFIPSGEEQVLVAPHCAFLVLFRVGLILLLVAYIPLISLLVVPVCCPMTSVGGERRLRLLTLSYVGWTGVWGSVASVGVWLWVTGDEWRGAEAQGMTYAVPVMHGLVCALMGVVVVACDAWDDVGNLSAIMRREEVEV